jgi:glutaminase
MSDPESLLDAVSTGRLPEPSRVDQLLLSAYERYRDLDEGEVADYIPILAEADPALFGLSVAEINGATHDAGDSEHAFSIQSISKAFVFALVVQQIGADEALARIGVNNTGLPFNSVMALELNQGNPMNPMVNAGALVTTGLVPGQTEAAKWDFIQAGLSAFAGRQLILDEVVYESEAATNQRNQGIARLLQSYDRITFDPLQVTDVYTKQCALLVTAHDLALMGATLADGGVNPVTGARVVDAEVCSQVLATMATAGLYEHSGDWLFEIGMPGKSGVAGGIVTIAPGKGGLGTFSPRLDSAGNSVRGKRATRYLSGVLGMNLFASKPND